VDNNDEDGSVAVNARLSLSRRPRNYQRHGRGKAASSGDGERTTVQPIARRVPNDHCSNFEGKSQKFCSSATWRLDSQLDCCREPETTTACTTRNRQAEQRDPTPNLYALKNAVERGVAVTAVDTMPYRFEYSDQILRKSGATRCSFGGYCNGGATRPITEHL
jgi:hypothetical protein